MVYQVYGEAWLTSIDKVRCQDHEPGIGLGLGFWKAVGAGNWLVYTECPSPRLGKQSNSFEDYSEARVTSMVMVDGHATVM